MVGFRCGCLILWSERLGRLPSEGVHQRESVGLQGTWRGLLRGTFSACPGVGLVWYREVRMALTNLVDLCPSRWNSRYIVQHWTVFPEWTLFDIVDESNSSKV